MPVYYPGQYALALAIEASAEVIMELKDRTVCSGRDGDVAIPATPEELSAMQKYAVLMYKAKLRFFAECKIDPSTRDVACSEAGAWSYRVSHAYIKDWLWVRVDLRQRVEEHFVY